MLLYELNTCNGCILNRKNIYLVSPKWRWQTPDSFPSLFIACFYFVHIYIIIVSKKTITTFSGRLSEIIRCYFSCVFKINNPVSSMIVIRYLSFLCLNKCIYIYTWPDVMYVYFNGSNMNIVNRKRLHKVMEESFMAALANQHLHYCITSWPT